MGDIDVELLDSKDFPWLLTVYEMLETVIVHCERAQDAQDILSLHANMIQAVSALKAALEVYAMRLKREKQE